jgi:hypothetical protein
MTRAKLWLAGVLTCACVMLFPPVLRAASDPIVVKPHPQAGKFRLEHDPDRPLLSFYGGIGLRQLEDGRWTGYGQTSPKDVEFLIQRCVQNGIKRIYGSFQEEGYPSELAPAASGPSETDYVALCIRLAHENNIQVYADQPTFAFVQERNREFVEKNPHFFTRSASGEHDTHMLSAAYPEVRRFKRSLLMEWVKNYPIDGLQLDFIRFPYYTKDIRVGHGVHGYDAPSLAAFRALYGYGADYQPRPDDPRWLRMKSELVSQFIRELRADLKASGISLPIGVYNSGMYGRADSLRTVHQDWRAWEEERLVDEHSPMFYMSNGMANLAGAIKSLSAVKNAHSRIIGPIFLAEGYADGPPPTADDVRDAARRLIKLGCDELWFCRASEIEEFGFWPVVKEISQWSIRDIRAQDFDPAYENLLKNGDFQSGLANWTASPTAAATVSKGDTAGGADVLRVEASAAGPASVSQSIRFRAIPHLALDSLSVAARVRVPAARPAAAPPPALAVELRYLNGETETKTCQLKDLGDAWKRVRFDVKARTDFAKLLATEAVISLQVPPGTGSVEFADVQVERDPLVDRGGTTRIR